MQHHANHLQQLILTCFFQHDTLFMQQHLSSLVVAGLTKVQSDTTCLLLLHSQLGPLRHPGMTSTDGTSP